MPYIVPCHSPTSYFILRNINLLRHNIQILANMVSRSARRRPPLCVAARRALIFEGWVRGPEFTHTDHAVDIDNGLGWTIIVVAAGHRHYGGVVTRLRRRRPHFVPACDRDPTSCSDPKDPPRIPRLKHRSSGRLSPSSALRKNIRG